MELKDVVKTFELNNAERDHLNGFLENGWRIIETLKERVTNGEDDGPFDEQIRYVLGTDKNDTKLGASYQKVQDDLAALDLSKVRIR